jgi:poly(3-hydroxybutyrate) depolymerase
MSAGAAMAVVVGRTHPDLFAAVGAHSGLPHGAAADLPSALRARRQGAAPAATAGRGTPTIVFHGDRDATVHRANAEQVLRQATAGVTRPLLTVHQSPPGAARPYTRYVYRDPDGGVLAEGWAVRGLGHAWSGGDPAGSYTDAEGPDASAEMVRFFAEHARG